MTGWTIRSAIAASSIVSFVGGFVAALYLLGSILGNHTPGGQQ